MRTNTEHHGPKHAGDQEAEACVSGTTAAWNPVPPPPPAACSRPKMARGQSLPTAHPHPQQPRDHDLSAKSCGEDPIPALDGPCDLQSARQESLQQDHAGQDCPEHGRGVFIPQGLNTRLAETHPRKQACAQPRAGLISGSTYLGDGSHGWLTAVFTAAAGAKCAYEPGGPGLRSWRPAAAI